MRDDIYTVFKRIPTIITERLTLRCIQKKDINDIYEYSKNPNTSKYLLWYKHESILETKKYYNIVMKKYKQGKFFDWAIIDNASGKMIGTCGYTLINKIDNNAEIGYVINPSFSNRGIATEAVKRIIEFGFDFLGFERIEARYIIENVASKRVMEKCHMTFEGIERHAVYSKESYRDIGVFSILSDEYNLLVKAKKF